MSYKFKEDSSKYKVFFNIFEIPPLRPPGYGRDDRTGLFLTFGGTDYELDVNVLYGVAFEFSAAKVL